MNTKSATATATETLGFVRRATAKRDGGDGFLFIHHWPTGWQELVFPSRADAARFLAAANR